MSFYLSKKNKNNILLFVAIIFFMTLIWARFIIKRLPSDIPVNLTEFSFMVLIFTCVVLIIILVIILFKLTPKSTLITRIIDQSLKTFHKYLTYDVFPDRQGVIFQIKVIKIFFKKPKSIIYVFIITKIIQIFFVILLFIEVFIYKKIHFFYLLSPALGIVLLFKYLVFLFSIVLEERIKMIDERVTLIYVKHGATYYSNYVDYARNRKSIFAQEWINEMTFKELNLISHDCDINTTIKEQYIQSLHPLVSLKEARKKFNGPVALKNVQNAASLAAFCSVILYRLNLIKYKYDQVITLMILIISLIIWVYVLVKSVHTLPNDAFYWLYILIPKYENPFNN